MDPVVLDVAELTREELFERESFLIAKADEAWLRAEDADTAEDSRTSTARRAGLGAEA